MLRDLFSLFPAYAGVIRTSREPPPFSSAFPRIRGGDPKILPILALKLCFSPHTRG